MDILFWLIYFIVIWHEYGFVNALFILLFWIVFILIFGDHIEKTIKEFHDTYF